MSNTYENIRYLDKSLTDDFEKLEFLPRDQEESLLALADLQQYFTRTLGTASKFFKEMRGHLVDNLHILCELDGEQACRNKSQNEIISKRQIWFIRRTLNSMLPVWDAKRNGWVFSGGNVLRSKSDGRLWLAKNSGLISREYFYGKGSISERNGRKLRRAMVNQGTADIKRLSIMRAYRADLIDPGTNPEAYATAVALDGTKHTQSNELLLISPSLDFLRESLMYHQQSPHRALLRRPSYFAETLLCQDRDAGEIQTLELVETLYARETVADGKTELPLWAAQVEPGYDEYGTPVQRGIRRVIRFVKVDPTKLTKPHMVARNDVFEEKGRSPLSLKRMIAGEEGWSRAGAMDTDFRGQCTTTLIGHEWIETHVYHVPTYQWRYIMRDSGILRWRGLGHHLNEVACFPNAATETLVPSPASVFSKFSGTDQNLSNGYVARLVLPPDIRFSPRALGEYTGSCLTLREMKDNKSRLLKAWNPETEKKGLYDGLATWESFILLDRGSAKLHERTPGRFLAKAAGEIRELVDQALVMQKPQKPLTAREAFLETRKLLGVLSLCPVDMQQDVIKDFDGELDGPPGWRNEIIPANLMGLLLGTRHFLAVYRHLYRAVRYQGLKARWIELLSAVQRGSFFLSPQNIEKNEPAPVFPEAYDSLIELTLLDAVASPKRLVTALAWFFAGQLDVKVRSERRILYLNRDGEKDLVTHQAEWLRMRYVDSVQTTHIAPVLEKLPAVIPFHRLTVTASLFSNWTCRRYRHLQEGNRAAVKADPKQLFDPEMHTRYGIMYLPDRTDPVYSLCPNVFDILRIAKFQFPDNHPGNAPRYIVAKAMILNIFDAYRSELDQILDILQKLSLAGDGAAIVPGRNVFGFFASLPADLDLACQHCLNVLRSGNSMCALCYPLTLPGLLESLTARRVSYDSFFPSPRTLPSTTPCQIFTSSVLPKIYSPTSN